MTRFICMNGIFLTSLLLQSCIVIGMIHDVEAHVLDQKRLSSTEMMMETPKNIEKRAARISTSTTAVCYDAEDTRHIRLWNGRAPHALGNNPCKDIPFMWVFMPKRSAPHTDVSIIIMPGGGYDKLTDVNEQLPVARYFADELGITTFILYYRLVNKKDGTYRYPVPMWDAQRAIRYVRSNAAHFNINPNHVGVFGFSAGGHLASTIALHSDQNFGLKNTDSLDQINARPMFLGIGYPVISMDPKHSPNSLKHLLHGYSGKERTHLENFLSGQKNVGPNTPPTFIFTSLDDQQISPQNSLLFIKALESAHIPHEAQVFKHGHHGVGLAENEPEEKVWPKLFGKWLKTMKLIWHA